MLCCIAHFVGLIPQEEPAMEDCERLMGLGGSGKVPFFYGLTLLCNQNHNKAPESDRMELNRIRTRIDMRGFITTRHVRTIDNRTFLKKADKIDKPPVGHRAIITLRTCLQNDLRHLPKYIAGQPLSHSYLVSNGLDFKPPLAWVRSISTFYPTEEVPNISPKLLRLCIVLVQFPCRH